MPGDRTDPPPPDARLRATLDTVHDAVVVIDATGRVVDANRAIHAILGHDPEALIGAPVTTLMHEPDASAHDGYLARYLETRRGVIIGRGREVVARHADGRQVHVELAVSPFELDGQLYFCGTLRDLSAQKAAERERSAALVALDAHRSVLENLLAERSQRLDTSEQFHHSVFDALSPHVAVLDESLEIVLVNAAWQSFGRANGAAQALADVGSSYERALEGAIAAGDDDARVVRRGLRALLAGEIEELVHEYPCHSPSEDRWFVLRATRFRCSRGTFVVTAHENVTDQRRAAAELARSQEQLRQAQKMEAIGQLAGGMAHDFNNLLTAIRYHVSFAVAGLDAGSDAARELRQIEQATERASELTRQLVAFSRGHTVAPTLVEPGPLAEEILPMLRRLVGSRIGIATRLAPEARWIRADRGQLHQVITNLVVNARDAIPDSGTVTLETRNDTDGEGRAWVVLSVTDDGIGMSAEVQARVFEPFFTTKAPGRGSGLGLSMVYGIVTHSGGRVRVWSEPGRGARFELRFPRFDRAPSERPLPPRSTAASEPCPGGRILLVEDEVILRNAAQRTLRGAGHTVLVGTATEALRLLEDPAEVIDLLVTDVMMPGMSGLELARRGRRARPGLAVLLLSGYTAESMDEGELARLAFLAKPFTPAELVAKVCEVLEDARARGR